MLQSACEPLIALNPCEGIRLPRRRRQDTADQVIRRDQVRKAAACGTRTVPPSEARTFANAVGKPLWRTLFRSGSCDLHL